MDTFCSRDYKLTSFTPFPTHDTMESTIQNTALHTRYRCIITAKHEALTVPSFNWDPDGSGIEIRDQLAHKARHRQWWRWLSPVQDTTQPMTNIAYDRSRWVQDDINYFQWLQSTTGHRRSRDCTPERVNSRRKPRELTPNDAQGASPTLKTMITSTRPFLRVNWARSPVQAPLNAAISRPRRSQTIYESAQL